VWQTKQLQENTNLKISTCEMKGEDSLFMKLRKSKSEEGLVEMSGYQKGIYNKSKKTSEKRDYGNSSG
jgi:hypothetical protein